MKIVYIIGNARSGSTILSILLGNHTLVTSVGELKVVAERAWVASEYCSCGNLGKFCKFWSVVRSDLATELGDDNIQELVQLQLAFDRGFNVPSLLVDGKYGGTSFKNYTVWMKALFQSIARHTGAHIVLDSSKNLARGYALHKIFGQDIFFIHMVRDSRATVWSLMKAYKKNQKNGINRDMKPRNPLKASALWTYNNIMTECLLKKLSCRSLKLRYEDLTENTEKTIGNIGEFLDLDMSKLVEKITSTKPLAISHMIAGNRLRMTTEVKFKSDYEWKSRMPRDIQKKVWLTTGWLARRYGYAMSDSVVL